MKKTQDSALEQLGRMRKILLERADAIAVRIETDLDENTELIARAMLSILKLIDCIDKLENTARERMIEEQEQAYTPYDQIPPPSPEDAARIDARLDDIFNRLRRAAIADGLYQGIDPSREDVCAPRLEALADELSKTPRD